MELVCKVIYGTYHKVRRRPWLGSSKLCSLNFRERDFRGVSEI